MKQGGKTRFYTLKFGTTFAPNQTQSLIPFEKPVIEAADNVRRATAVGVKASRPEGSNDLTRTNLFCCPSSYAD